MKNALISFLLIGMLFVAIMLLVNLSDGSTEVTDPIPSTISKKSTTNNKQVQALTLVTFDPDMCSDSQYIYQAMESAPEKTLLDIDLLANNQEQEICYQSALLAWSDINFNALLKKVVSLVPDKNLDLAISSLAEKYNSNLTYAIVITEKLFDKTLKEKTLVKLLDIWASEAPNEALSWAMMQTIDSSITWIELIFETISSQDISLAISSLSALKDGELEQVRAAIQVIINNFDPALANASVLEVIASLEPERLKAEIIVALLPLMFASDNISLADLDYLISSLSSGEIRDDLYQSLARNWVFTDPLEAAAYAESLEGSSRELAISAVVSNWMYEDLNATDEWLSTVNGNIDLAAETLGRGSSEIGNIEISDDWIDVIEDNEIRTNAAIDIINDRYEKDPAMGIYHLVFQKNVSDQEKLAILHKMYPDEIFITPMQALDELGRLENLNSPLNTQNVSAENPSIEKN